MTKLLLRIFIPRQYGADSPSAHSAIGKLASITGILCNLLLFLVKLVVGLFSGSVSILGDAVNNLFDTASSVISLLGFRLAQRPADEDHPYGHGRYEYISGLIIAAIILIIGAQLGIDAIKRIFHPASVYFSLSTLIVLLCAIALKLWMRTFFRSLGNQIHSPTLLAVSADCRNDALTSSAVLVSCIVTKLFPVNLDGYAGCAVAVFILFSGIQIAKETISPLLGEKADQALVGSIRELVLSHDKVLGIHDLLVHDYGHGQRFASAHVELNAEEDPLACHDIIDHIERDALEQMNVHLVIHHDPVEVNDAERTEMYELLERIISDIHPDLSIHDFRIVRSRAQSKLVFDLSVPYSMHSLHDEIHNKIDDALAANEKAYLTEIQFDEST